MNGPDNFITGAAIGAFAIMLFSHLPIPGGSAEQRERRDCIFSAKSVDCVQVWVPVGEAKQ